MKDTENTDRHLPITHELKCWPEPFAAVVDGSKPFEWRLNDRGYRVGDTLWLREWDPALTVLSNKDGYTGQHVHRTVTYIIREGFGIPPGYCIMGLAAARSKDKERIEALQASLLDVAEKSTARIAALEAGLRELVRLKDETDQVEVILAANPNDADAQKKRWDLRDVKPAAWDAARALLNQQPPTA